MTDSTLVGWDTQDITPDQPVELIGQYYQRVSRGLRDRLTVTAMALEREGGGAQAVMVSLEILFVTRDFMEEVRQEVVAQVPELDPRAIFLNATHIHSGPSWFAPFRWWVPAGEVTPPAEIRAFILERTVRAVVRAWRIRRPGQTASAGAWMDTGFCRRMLYADGHATMYGEVDCKDFAGVESANDPEVRMLFTWDKRECLTGLILNVACPAQVMEAGYEISADFFGELRQRIHRTYGPEVHLLAQVSAAGCQSPRNMPGQSKSEVNYWNEQGISAIADRLEKVVAEGYAAARARRQTTGRLMHAVKEISLPVRRATLAEYQSACSEVERIAKNYPDVSTASRELFALFVEDVHAREKVQDRGPFDDKELDFVHLENAQAVMTRYETQDSEPLYPMELHALRIGDSVFVTNPFELFLDYGQMICARSRAARTFVVQFACDSGGYLPTARAVAAGGYSALIINGRVGPEGGRSLVDATVQAINELWEQ
jgi:hypothetical protein